MFILVKEFCSSLLYLIVFKGLVYTITDVPDLCEWMKKHFAEHPLFEAVSEDELVIMNTSYSITNLLRWNPSGNRVILTLVGQKSSTRII